MASGVQGSGLGWWVEGCGLRVESWGCRVQGVGICVWNLELRVSGAEGDLVLKIKDLRDEEIVGRPVGVLGWSRGVFGLLRNSRGVAGLLRNSRGVVGGVPGLEH